MQLSGYKHTQSQISFSSDRFFPVVVRDMNNMPVKAWFSQLNLSDPVDVAAMKTVKNSWTEKKGDAYTRNIYSQFEEGKPVYAVELDSKKGSLYDKLLGLASYHIEGNDTFKLDFLQASPNSSFKAPKGNREYRGAGTALMYGLVKIAEIVESKLFKLYSATSDNFYDRLKMEKRGIYMTYDRPEMGDFLKRQESEFDLLLQKQPKKTEEMALKCS